MICIALPTPSPCIARGHPPAPKQFLRPCLDRGRVRERSLAVRAASFSAATYPGC
jgi:hypothetical protein